MWMKCCEKRPEKCTLCRIFFFIDFSCKDSLEDCDIYGEIYPSFSFSKISGHKIDFGPIKDVGIVTGLNYGLNVKVLKFLPGLSISWDIPGFNFVTTNFMAYIDANSGVNSGGAPKEGNAFMLGVAWAYPFEVYGQKFSIEGHVEYLTERTNEFGGISSDWFLAQPQVRWYIAPKVSVGIEYQLWLNKLGEKGTDESIVQALFVFEF